MGLKPHLILREFHRLSVLFSKLAPPGFDSFLQRCGASSSFYNKLFLFHYVTSGE